MIHAFHFARELWRKTFVDQVWSGAAALAYYLMLSFFPAAIALLSLLAFLPLTNLPKAILDFASQMLPVNAAELVNRVLSEIWAQPHRGFLSFGVTASLWAASSGVVAVMEQLNATDEIKETRSFWKIRAIALALSMIFLLLIAVGLVLLICSGLLQTSLKSSSQLAAPVIALLEIVPWILIFMMLLYAFAFTYYFAPNNGKAKFHLFSAGSVAGVFLFIGVSILFRLFVSYFGSFGASYGSLGAVITFLFWLYYAALSLLVGSEINALYKRPLQKFRPQPIATYNKLRPRPF
jgi:membrane protein